MIRQLKDLFFNVPWIFNSWRNLVHKGFSVEKKIIRVHIPSNSRIIDFGCGTGMFASFVQVKEYVGVDVPGKHLCYAKSRMRNTQFLTFNKELRTRLKSNYFDHLICFHVVHHVLPEGLLKFSSEILRLVKPGGSILIVDMFPVKQQESLFGKLLTIVDRGNYQRLPQDVIKLFGQKITLIENYPVKIGPFKMYVLLMKKR